MDHWLLRAAAIAPDRVALATADAQLSYAQLEALARAAGGGLLAHGVSPGDRVALALPTGPELIAALHGCFLVGAVAVPIDLRLTAAEQAARSAGATVVIGERLRGTTGVEPVELRPEAVAAVVHTSGTTAAAKPVELTFGNWLASALGSAMALGLDPEERWLCPLPLAHVGGLSIPIRSAIYATTAIVHERFSAALVAEALMDPVQEITLVSLVPTMLARLLDEGLFAPPTLRWALLGGGPIAPALLERAAEAGVPVAPTYGMTETCSQIATHGSALLGVSVRVADDGEVLVQGPIVSAGALAPDGWLYTGDLGELDERGRLTIIGRKADTIVTGGENVSPIEVEAVLLAHPAVADAAAFGRPDPEWGQALVAKVVARDRVTLDPAELRAFCAARLAGFKVPKKIELTAALPRSESGKLRRSEL
jgi:O-succinylbenzoic acid--CoA ligase